MLACDCWTFIFSFDEKIKCPFNGGNSNSSLRTWIRDQHFPCGVPIGKKMYWTPTVVQAWLDAKFMAQEQLAKTLTAKDLRKTARRLGQSSKLKDGGN
jgi:hypothetical protein